MPIKKGKGIMSPCPLPFRFPSFASNSHSVWEPPPGSVVLRALDAVFLSELFDPAGRIDEFLLAREERVAFGADLHVNRRHRGAGLDHVAARADDLRLFVFWMDALFHNQRNIPRVGGGFKSACRAVLF